jgi:ABC-type uncharacterized transport system auxiliary subunit
MMMRRTMSPDRRMAVMTVIAAALAIAGCVQVTAPTDPITINLNINIRQEVVYRLDGSARELIEQNTEIF